MLKKSAIAATLGVSLVCAFVYARAKLTHAFTFSSEIAESVLANASIEHVAHRIGPQDDWPQWRGDNRDGKSGSSELLKEWPDSGPPLHWQIAGLGKGMSSVVVTGGRVYTMGLRGEHVYLIALDEATGQEIWATNIAAESDRPNGTPTVDGNQVFAMTYDGRLVCVTADLGTIEWQKRCVEDFSGTVPRWGYSEAPLVDAERVVITPGADQALMAAVDRTTGETIWTTPYPDAMRDKGHPGAGYSSSVMSQAASVRQYIQQFGGGVIGVAADDGRALWGYSRVANWVAVIPTPIVDGDLVLVSSGYGAGAALLELKRTEIGIDPVERYFLKGNKIQNHHGGMILLDGNVFVGHGHNNGLPLCFEFTTGNILWGPVRGPGTGSAAIAYADGNLYFRYENGKMAIIAANPKGYELKSAFSLPSKLDKSWPHPVIAGGKLYLRDDDVLMCYDVALHPAANDNDHSNVTGSEQFE